VTDSDATTNRALTARFQPGEGVAIIADTAVCLLLDEPTSALVALLGPVLRDGSGADAALEAMVRSGGLDLPPFALVAIEDDQVRVVVRGRIGAWIHAEGEPVELTGSRVRTWVEHVADDARSVRLSVDASVAPDAALDFEATGVVPAAVLDVVVGSGLAGTESPAVPKTSGAPVIDVPALPIPDVALMDTGDAAEGAVDIDVVPGSADVGPIVRIDDVDRRSVDEPFVDDPAELTRYEPEPIDLELVAVEAPHADDSPLELPVPPEVGDPGSVVDPPESGEPLDHGATLIGPFDLDGHDVEEPDRPDPDGSGELGAPASDIPTPPPFPTADAALDVAATTGGVDDYDHLFGATQFRTVEQAAVRPSDADVDDGQEALISSLPGGSPVDEAPDGTGDGDHDGHTVSMASLRAQLQQSAPTPGTSPSVHAVHCPAGHLNPTHAGTCRVCGATILDQEHVSVPRPVLGTLQFSDGRVVIVSRPLIIGRSPTTNGRLSGEAPELVVVPSPLKEVSSTHLEVRLEGWQVLVIDRQSTNGTIVTAPGRDPQRLRPGEPVPITPGTRVNLADEAEFVFEAKQ
jgi:hypothetical protein